jgi:FMN phosphatase YigB (HAD superfamily)
MAANIEAITFDWYGTLAGHRRKMRRGRLFSEYLASHNLESASWDRRVLYDVFDYYGSEYEPELSDEEKRIFWIQFTRLLFERSQVSGSMANNCEIHAAAIRDIFGSGCFELYVDVRSVLCALKLAIGHSF